MFKPAEENLEIRKGKKKIPRTMLPLARAGEKREGEACPPAEKKGGVAKDEGKRKARNSRKEPLW